MREDDSTSVKEGLASLFLWWYGNHRLIRTELRQSWRQGTHLQNARKESDEREEDEEELTPQQIEEAWCHRWFAKGELQADVDGFLRTEFAWLLHTCDHQDVPDITITKLPLWEKMALLILCDQVTRNVFRGTEKAYQGDAVAIRIAQYLLVEYDIQELPLRFLCTICISMCHSERQEIQAELKAFVTEVLKRYSGGPYDVVLRALQEIQVRHEERILQFGRFPERNTALQRQSTTKELSFLSQL